jgi:hypothetical protein
MPADPELRSLTSESGASVLVQKVGTVFACSSSPSNYLDGYKSPQHGLMINGFHSRDHLAGTCYEVMNVSVQMMHKLKFLERKFLSRRKGDSPYIRANNLSG